MKPLFVSALLLSAFLLSALLLSAFLLSALLLSAFLLSALLGLSLIAPASAASRLSATSNTAMSITGDVTLAANRITFGNGKSVAIRKIASAKEGQWDPAASGTAKADVYELAKPQDPKLVRGNRLCGSGPVRYLAFFKTGDGLTEMVVFNPKADPFGSGPDRVCATYTYGG